MNGLYYYKLVSPYTEDVTKNCKLTINEIDSNFFNLKSNDIDSAEFVREQKVLVLTRKNGEKLFVDLSSVTYDFGLTTEENESGTTLTFSYDSASGKKNVKIENVMTADNVKDYIRRESKVITDGTLIGDGNSNHPLGIKRTEMTGMFAPALGLIDVTNCEQLPSEAKLGTRYITKEYVNDYGYLYNGFALKKIALDLSHNDRGWRIPTKADWDALLNSIEPCEYRNHDSAKCHIELGKYAGKYLKSECGWLGQAECSCNNTVPQTGCTSLNNSDGYIDADDLISGCGCQSGNGCDCTNNTSASNPSMPKERAESVYGTDRFGFTILPSGVGRLDAYGRPETNSFKEKGVFWTSTHVNGDIDQDSYVKEFDWNRGGVQQSAECPRAYYSLRLVKDYDGTNNFGAEYIDGILYNTILAPQSNQIWLASNYAGRGGLDAYYAEGIIPDYMEVNDGQIVEKRKEFFVNEWNGRFWEKKLLKEGDTIVLENARVNDNADITTEVTWVDGEGESHVVEVVIPKVAQHNVEYRIFTSDINCDKELINTDDLVVERVVNIVVPMLEAEREERVNADRELDKKIEDETSARIVSEEKIRLSIEEERDSRIFGDSQLWDAVTKEASARTEVDSQLWEAINGETARAQEVETQLWEGINGETERAQQVEAQLWEGINGETERAQEVEAQLWDAIAQETSARTDVDDQIWEALNNEIERAKAREDEIDGQLISADVEYVMKVAEGFDLVQKNGGLIHIGFDGNYGQI